MSPSAYSLEDSADTHISAYLLYQCQLLDYLCLTCCIHFNESIPINSFASKHTNSQTQRQSLISNNNSNNSNNNAINSNNNTINSNNNIINSNNNARKSMISNNLSLDIERLFAQKVLIYDYTAGCVSVTTNNLSNNTMNHSNQSLNSINNQTNQTNITNINVIIPTLDTIINIIMKSSIKSIYEMTRLVTISHITYLLLQTHSQLLKTVCNNILRDTNEIEILINQLNNSLFNRFIDANNINIYMKTGHEINEVCVCLSVYSFVCISDYLCVCLYFY